MVSLFPEGAIFSEGVIPNPAHFSRVMDLAGSSGHSAVGTRDPSLRLKNGYGQMTPPITRISNVNLRCYCSPAFTALPSSPSSCRDAASGRSMQKPMCSSRSTPRVGGAGRTMSSRFTLRAKALSFNSFSRPTWRRPRPATFRDPIERDGSNKSRRVRREAEQAFSMGRVARSRRCCTRRAT